MFKYMTGYYGVSGKIPTSKVHLLIKGIPACGSIFGRLAEFHWCSNTLHYSYLTCEKCKKKAKKIITKDFNNIIR